MDNLEIAKEAVKLYFDENINTNEATEKAKIMCLGTGQSNQGAKLNNQ